MEFLFLAQDAVSEILDGEGKVITKAIKAQNAVYKTETKWFETDKIPSDEVVPKDAIIKSMEEDGSKPLLRRKLNPNYTEGQDYIQREDRPEWSTVGLMGKLRVLKGQQIANNWILMREVSDLVDEYLVK